MADILGSTAHKEHVFSADFEAEEEEFDVGLIAGYTGKKDPYYRFLMSRKGEIDLFTLEKVSGRSSKRIEKATFEMPAVESSKHRASLMFDGSSGQELRFYRDNRLIMVHHAEAVPSGGSGIYVEPGTRTKASNLIYDSRRENVYRGRFEKNAVFVDDAFMRHWSSPEGEWLPLTNGLTWHKSDFFGGFVLKMPFIPGSRIHLGVGEEGTNGVLAVSATADELILLAGEKTLASVPMKKLTEAPSRATKEKTQVRTYSINYEDHWLWVTSGGEVLFKHAVAAPFEGRRIRLAGLTSDQLKDSHVERLKVKDYLFTESPFEWTVNGGTWSVVNRFFCQPKWSHMNGESKDTVAALWTKYTYGGDFCLEMYAGMRHNWYERPGDLNMTIMASDTSPSLGYTITCTGWDPDHSQLYTKLYRNGKELAVSDKYLVPRARAGNQRKGYNPLIQAGSRRALHGAWYYMKLRRIGNKLEYHFDNELVLSVDDDEPLNDGLAGIWTFMNSMMVARVKIAAERIEPRSLKVTPVADASSFELADLAEPIAETISLHKDELPFVVCHPSFWKAEDPVGHIRLGWHRKDNHPYFSAQNVLGSGNMFVRCLLPQKASSSIAGWQFEIKRSDAAKFNFHFSIGQMKGEEYVPVDNVFHRLSGTSFSEGNYVKVGESVIPGIAADGEGWHEKGEWVKVTAWVPPSILRKYPTPDKMYVRAEGFGIAQPCYELAGLLGNGPGAGYAVRKFSEIGYEAPTFTMATESPYSSLTVQDGGEVVPCNDVVGLQKWIRGHTNNGHITASIVASNSNITDTADATWLNNPEIPEITCSWSKDHEGFIDIVKPGSYPNRQFGLAKVTIGGAPAAVYPRGNDRLQVAVPRKEEFLVERSDTVLVEIVIGQDTLPFDLAWKDNPLKSRPVLLNLDGAVGFFESFELQDAGKVSSRPLSVNRASAQEEREKFRRAKRKRLKRSQWRNSSKANISIGARDDDISNRYMEISNGGNEARLKTYFAVPRSIVRYPLLGFNYKAEGMAHISVMPTKSISVKLSESHGASVPWSTPLTLDNKWRSWLGDISKLVRDDNREGDPFSMTQVSFGSMHRKDQTGRFSKWNIDNVVLGPAVCAPEQLTFSADYFEFAGIESVRVSTRGGEATFDSLTEEQKKELKWTSYEDKEEIVPNIDGLNDGLCFMAIQAKGKNGRDSEVTEVPFLLDRVAPECSFAFEEDKSPLCNGSMLKVKFKSRGYHSSINPAQMTLACGDNDLPLSLESRRSRIDQRGNTDHLYLNWPYMFREQLNASTNGQVMKMVLSDIGDGAGNRAPDLVIPHTIDYSKDRRPPTIMSMTAPSNILWRLSWKTDKDEVSPFNGGKGCKTVVVWPEDEEPYIETGTHKGNGELSRSMAAEKWSITNYPYLSFRMKRPSLTESNTARVSVMIDLGGTKELIALTDDGKKGIRLPDPIAWNSNRWARVTLDLPKLLGKSAKGKRRKSVLVRSISIKLSDGSKKKEEQEKLLLQSLTIHKAWKESDEIEIDAYDASGMDGMTVYAEYDTDGVGISPLKIQKAGVSWMVVRAKDKAGNLTRPYRYPVGQASGKSLIKEGEQTSEASADAVIE